MVPLMRQVAGGARASLPTTDQMVMVRPNELKGRHPSRLLASTSGNEYARAIAREWMYLNRVSGALPVHELSAGHIGANPSWQVADVPGEGSAHVRESESRVSVELG